MQAMYEASPAAFSGFMKGTALARHRIAAPLEASEAARLVGVLAEDCGPCVQIVVDMARENGMADAQIEAVIKGDLAAMQEDTALGYRFARAIVERLPEANSLREHVRARWGDKGVLDLTLNVQISRLYPMIKLGMGYAKNCTMVTVGKSQMAPSYAGKDNDSRSARA
jgi:hypothetical protein